MSAGLVFLYVLLGFAFALGVFHIIVALKGGYIEVGRKRKHDRTNRSEETR